MRSRLVGREPAAKGKRVGRRYNSYTPPPPSSEFDGEIQSQTV